VHFSAPEGFDLERVIDDFVMLCYFCGNDFLPQLPSLSIFDGALDDIYGIYKEAMGVTAGYLTHQGEINMPRLGMVLANIAEREDDHFRRQADDKRRMAAVTKGRKDDQERRQREALDRRATEKMLAAATASAVEQEAKRQRVEGGEGGGAAADLCPDSNDVVGGCEGGEEEEVVEVDEVDDTLRRKVAADADAQEFFAELQKLTKVERFDDSVKDEIRFEEEGWKQRCTPLPLMHQPFVRMFLTRSTGTTRRISMWTRTTTSSGSGCARTT
jgi:5'-3' exonuclease